MKARTPVDLAPLRAAWGRQARRIDALSLRERAFIFLSVVAVVAALFDTLVLTPQSARAKQRGEQQTQQAAELAQLREQFVAASRNAADPSSGLRSQLDAALAERAQLDGALREAGSVSEGDGLSVVLQRLLSQQPGLSLEQLVLLEDAPVSLPSTGAAAGPLSLAGMRWQGVELRVRGRYGDIQRYLQRLERELPGLRWGDMRLSAGKSDEPSQLQARLFLLKVQP